jgi:hypothetical protein
MNCVACFATALLTILAILLAIERVTGLRKLAAVKAGMARSGQATEFRQSLVAAPPNFAEFTNRFAHATRLLGESATN